MMPSAPSATHVPITADRIARLRDFGLSEYAARAYLALLDLGTTEARDVSALSKVPASKIYHILDQLHEKGLVVILPEFPRKYAPVPFTDFLQRIEDEHASAVQSIRTQREMLTHMFAVLGDVAGGDRGSVTLLRGRRNVLERFSETLAAATGDALILLTAGQAANPRAWREPVDAALARGVRVRVLGADGPGEGRARSASLPAAAYALVVDARRALVGHALPDDGHLAEGNDTALAVDQEGIVALLAALLEAQWADAPAARAVPIREEQSGPLPSQAP